jgi:hypothetical protein
MGAAQSFTDPAVMPAAIDADAPEAGVTTVPCRLIMRESA